MHGLSDHISKRLKTSHRYYLSSAMPDPRISFDADDDQPTSTSSEGTKSSMSRADVLGLIRKKDEIDAEIKALHELLQSQGDVGMDGPLLDADGYPRSDIDVYSVRHARHKIICLTNDHKALMKQIEEGLYAVHAQARSEYMDTDNASLSDTKAAKPFAKIQFVTPESPAAHAHQKSNTGLFLPTETTVWNESVVPSAHVRPNFCPFPRAGTCTSDENRILLTQRWAQIVHLADLGISDGLQPGDLVTVFGSATSSNFKSLADLATIVNNSENRSLTIEVLRQGSSRRLTLTPKKWNGRGLLGCSFLEERQL